MDLNEQINPALPGQKTDAPSDIQVHIKTVTFRSGDEIEFPESGVVVVVGSNNSGKSTFLRHLNSYLAGGQPYLDSDQIAPLEVTMARALAPAAFLDWLRENGIFRQRPIQEGGGYFVLNSAAIMHSTVHAGHYSNMGDGLQDLHDLFVHYANTGSRLNASFSAPARGQVDDPPSDAYQRFQDRREEFEKLSHLSQRVFNTPLMLDDFSGSTIRVRVGTCDLPLPARDEPLGAFGREVGRLPFLDDQGDGMRSFFSLMIPIYSGIHKIILADEPEAFLHPPQARALGRELGLSAGAKGRQSIVATHDRDFISGLIESQAPLTVIRLDRSTGETRASQLDDSQIKSLWDDRDLRYSNVLDGLFCKLVVLCESDQDCRFYEAAFDHFSRGQISDTSTTLLSHDILFVPANGKSRFAKLVPIFQSLSVPVSIIADIDILQNRKEVVNLFEILGGSGALIQKDLTRSTDWLKETNPRKIREALAAINKELEGVILDEPERPVDGPVRTLISDQLRTTGSDWRSVKNAGFNAFRGEQRESLERLSAAFDERGISLVQVGELEGFAPKHSKNRQWLPEALKDGAHTSPEATVLVKRIIASYENRRKPVKPRR